MDGHETRIEMLNASHEINKILWALEKKTRMKVTNIRLSTGPREALVVIQLSIGDNDAK